MLHKMRLYERPFENIKNGTKTVEFRLNDEKRQKIQIGDEIEFTKLPNSDETLKVRVLDLYHARNFKDLFTQLYDDIKEIERKTESMYSIYTKEEEIKYGALGIKIELLK